MANLKIKDGDNTDKYIIKTGVGSDGDPFVDPQVGAITETAPGTDTASSGLNGRLQRIAQRITSLIALLPASLGQKTGANSFPVVLPSDQGAIPVTDNSGSLTVDAPTGTPVNVQIGDGTNQVSLLTSTADGAADAVNLIRTTARLMGFNGTTWDRIRANTTGLFAVGGLAHDDADTAGNRPVKVGYRAIGHGANPTAVAAADVTHGLANIAGIPFMIGGHPNIVTISASYTGTQTNTAVITVSAGTRIIVTSLALYADGGGTGPLDVQVGFGTSTITTTAAIIDHPGIAKGSGVVLGNGAGIVAMGADDADLRITAAGFGTGDELTICVSYYTITA